MPISSTTVFGQMGIYFLSGPMQMQAPYVYDCTRFEMPWEVKSCQHVVANRHCGPGQAWAPCPQRAVPQSVAPPPRLGVPVIVDPQRSSSMARKS